MSDNLPPSMQHPLNFWLNSNFYSWIVLILFLLFLIYMAKVVIQEKKQFLEDGHWIDWHNFRFFVPAWWTLSNDTLLTNDTQLTFYRADTHYDWFFKIGKREEQDLINIKNTFLASNQIELDDDAVITTEKSYLLKNEILLKKVEDFFRIESTATQQQEDRIYLDATWIKFRENFVLEFISKSSVLNGGVEGPYVEEVIKEIRFKN